MATYSNYSDQLPAGSYPIRNTDELLRSNFSVLARALDTESYFTSASASSASAGIARPGSARAYFGTRASLATPSSADSAGRFYFATDTNALLVLNAASVTTLVGGTNPVLYNATIPQQNVSNASWTLLNGSKLTVGTGTQGTYLVQVQEGINATSPSLGSSVRVAIMVSDVTAATGAYTPFNNFLNTVSVVTSASSGAVFSVLLYHDMNSTLSTTGTGAAGTPSITATRIG